MSLNRNLQQAKSQKNDDFYTQLPDIENELKHYRQHFAGKVVYCNCDDPKISNFYKYFSLNFEALGLRKLITTCYKNQYMDLFSDHTSEKAIWLECNQGTCENGAYVPADPVVRHLGGDGDFRSPECVELLKRADIVVTNPPFSLFREYVAQLVQYGKKFLIIGNKNAITYKEVFPLIKDNRMWVGHTPMGKDLLFDLPEGIARELKATKKEGSSYRIIDGVVKGRSQSIWFTNLDHRKRHEDLILYKRYSPEEYLTYDNYDAINVDKTAEIPMDWDGAMGVPITFLDKHNPEQFEVLGFSSLWDDGFKSHTFYDDYTEMRPDGTKTGLSGQKANGYPILRGSPRKGNYLIRGEEVVYTLYRRIFIRRKGLSNTQ